MKINLIDRSNYFKGLLLLIGKDKLIVPEEKELLLKIGSILDFEKDFIVESINDLLLNEYIIDEPPKFSSTDITKIFIRDGIKLAFADKELHQHELQWLKTVAEKNGIENSWCVDEVNSYMQNKIEEVTANSLEVNKLITHHG